MFYKFNSISQRVRPTSQVGSFSPQGFGKPVAETEILYQSKQKPSSMSSQPTLSQPLGGPVGAPAGGNFGLVPNNEAYKKIQEFQTKMTRQDGLLVWQKLPRDRMMYRGTMGLCAAGLGLLVYTLTVWSLPKKRD